MTSTDASLFLGHDEVLLWCNMKHVTNKIHFEHCLFLSTQSNLFFSVNLIYKPSHPTRTLSFLCQTTKSLSHAVSFLLVQEGWGFHLSLSPRLLSLFLKFLVINPLMKNLHNHHRSSHWRLSFCCPISSSLLPAATLAWAVPPTFFIPFLHSFLCFMRSSSHAGRVLQVCVRVHFPLCNPRNHKSCRSQLTCCHQSGFWI